MPVTKSEMMFFAAGAALGAAAGANLPFLKEKLALFSRLLWQGQALLSAILMQRLLNASLRKLKRYKTQWLK